VTGPRRNIELKARDEDAAATLERCRAIGAEDHGELRQVDTYFVAPAGRLKLREEQPGSAHLIAYDRADDATARESRYRIAPVAGAAAVRDALGAALGVTVEVRKRRRLFIWQGVRIHLDHVDGLGDFVELEGVAASESDLGRERALVERLRVSLGIDGDAIVAVGYADLLSAAESPHADALLRAAEAAMRRAYAPYSDFAVGAALRTPDGAVFSAANVENAAFPEGQCAEASAIGSMIAGGGREVAEVAVVAARRDICPPCGGCRQRLAEFASPSTPVHLGRPGGPRRTTTLGELLPLGFGAEALPGATRRGDLSSAPGERSEQ
jgi:homotetrameric cytidine deaminase